MTLALSPHVRLLLYVINTALTDLSNAIGVKNIKVAGLFGAPVHTKIVRLIVLVGDSHAKRLETQLKEAGERTCLVETPNFRVLNRDVVYLTSKIKVVLDRKKEDEAVILLSNINNCFFLARSEVGHHCPPVKDLDGNYHIDGELVCAPADTAKQLFLNMIPLLGSAVPSKRLWSLLCRATCSRHAALTRTMCQTWRTRIT
jgi:hypothetical protein